MCCAAASTPPCSAWVCPTLRSCGPSTSSSPRGSTGHSGPDSGRPCPVSVRAPVLNRSALAGPCEDLLRAEDDRTVDHHAVDGAHALGHGLEHPPRPGDLLLGGGERGGDVAHLARLHAELAGEPAPGGTQTVTPGRLDVADVG